MYGKPPAQLGQGQLARVELYVTSEKEGKLERICLEGNLKPQRKLSDSQCASRDSTQIEKK